jgi:hypothetical protein
MPSNPMPTTDAENRAPFFNRRRTTITVAAIVIVAGIVITIASVAHAGRMDAQKAVTPAPASSASASASATPTASTPAVPALPGSSSSIPAPASPSASRGAPAPITASADIITNLVASISNIEAIKGVASTPGEVAGPALRFNVQIKNATNAPANLSQTIVTVYYGEAKTPAIQLEKPGGAAFPASVAANSTALGTFVFTVPTNQRSDVRIEVDYAVGVTPLVFEGPVAQ